jgi:hypothetical protein
VRLQLQEALLPDPFDVHQLFELIFVDSQLNVYAGKFEVRPPGAPTRASDRPQLRIVSAWNVGTDCIEVAEVAAGQRDCVGAPRPASKPFVTALTGWLRSCKTPLNFARSNPNDVNRMLTTRHPMVQMCRPYDADCAGPNCLARNKRLERPRASTEIPPLEKDAPTPRRIQAPNEDRVVAFVEVDGLYHRCERRNLTRVAHGGNRH